MNSATLKRYEYSSSSAANTFGLAQWSKNHSRASQNLFTICDERRSAKEGPPERCPRDREAGSGREGGPQAARQPGGQCAAPGSPPSQSEADLLRPARRSAGTGAYT